MKSTKTFINNNHMKEEKKKAYFLLFTLYNGFRQKKGFEKPLIRLNFKAEYL